MSDVDVAVEEPTVTPPVDPPKAELPAESPADPPKEEPAPKTVAGGDDELPAEPVKGYWPEGWEEKIAEQVSAGDDKAYKSALKRIKRFVDPGAIFGSFTEAESKFTSGGLVKMPGKDASEEDIAAFHKALGVPEKPEDYFKDIQLANGAVIGEADKPLADSYAGAMHKAGATQAQMNAGMDWYYQFQEEQAADLDASDETFRGESQRALKDEFGSTFKRKTNAIASLFAAAPGGADVANPDALISRILAGRLALKEGEKHGDIIGNDPAMNRWLIGLAQEINPAATLLEDGEQSGKGIGEELAEISKFRRENKREYFKDNAMQARERELLDAQAKIKARAA